VDRRVRHLIRAAVRSSDMRVSPRSMIRPRFLEARALLAERQSRLPGEMAELGVCRGGSAKVLSLAAPNKVLHLFDTFKGIDAEMISTYDCDLRGWFARADLGDVKRYLSDCPNVAFHAGRFPGTAAGVEGPFCLVHLDCDLYASYRDGLRYFWTRMVDGGVILLDDYNRSNCPGATRAVNEFFKDKKTRPRAFAGGWRVFRREKRDA